MKVVSSASSGSGGGVGGGGGGGFAGSAGTAGAAVDGRAAAGFSCSLGGRSSRKRSSASVPAATRSIGGSGENCARGARAVVAWGSPTAGAARAVTWAWAGPSPNSTGGSTGGSSSPGEVPAAGGHLANTSCSTSTPGSARPPAHSVSRGAGGTPDAAAGVGAPTAASQSSVRVELARGAPSPGVSIVGTLDVEEEEWTRYVASLDLLRLPEHASALPLLGEVLAGVPVPAPWLLCRGPDGELFFANETTQSSSFTHPFHASLQKLARLCPTLLSLPKTARRSLITALREAWGREANNEFGLWCAAKSETTGQEYYYHCETLAVMWENPRDVILPALDLKIQAVDLLEDDAYMLRILCSSHADIRNSAAQVRQLVAEAASAAHAEIVADLLGDECQWIREAAAEALLELGEVGKSAPSTTTSWFSATSRVTVQSAP